MLVVQGDFAKLDYLLQKFGRLASPDFRDLLLRELAKEIRDLVADGFEMSQDPYGQPWAPLKKRPKAAPRSWMLSPKARFKDPKTGGRMFLMRDWDHPPLIQTGAMRGSRRTRIVDGGVQLSISGAKNQASFHQSGTRTIPRRRMVPDDGDIPERWRQALEEIVTRKLEELLRES